MNIRLLCLMMPSIKRYTKESIAYVKNTLFLAMPYHSTFTLDLIYIDQKSAPIVILKKHQPEIAQSYNILWIYLVLSMMT